MSIPGVKGVSGVRTSPPPKQPAATAATQKVARAALSRSMDDAGPALEKKFNTQLLALDLNSRTFKSDIQNLIILLDSLVRHNRITPAQKELLTSALKSIENPHLFKETLCEGRIWSALSESSPDFKEALDKATPHFKNLEQDARKKYLQAIQNPDSNIQVEKRNIRKTLATQRLDYIISKMPADKQPSPHFIPNFLYLHTSLKNFVTSTHEFIQNFWTIILKGTEPEHTQRFLQILDTYPELSPQYFIPELLHLSERNFLRPITFTLLSSHEPQPFAEKINTRKAKSVNKVETFVTQCYGKYLLEPHAWIATNLPNIVKPYSQSADIHCNQSEGTCLQNSLDRHALLLKDPTIPGSKIPMGSTPSGRSTHARLAHGFNTAKKGTIPVAQIAKLQADSSKRVGLINTTSSPLCSTPDTLITHLEEQPLSLLILTSPTDGGHALNIQIDHTTHLYRLIDDNTGVIEWSNYKTFRTQLQSYLTHFYPSYNQFFLTSFKPVK